MAEEPLHPIFKEGGFVENISAGLWAIALVIAAYYICRKPSLIRVSCTVLLLWAFLRELDFQKLFTYRSVESIGFYTRPNATLFQKTIALVVLLPFAAAGLHLLLWLKKRFRTAIAQGEPWCNCAFAVIGLAIVAAVSEKLFGLNTVEEIAELTIAAVILVLTIKSAPQRTGPSQAAPSRVTRVEPVS